MKHLIFALALAGCSLESQGYVVESSKTERFDLAPNDGISYVVPDGAVDWRLAGNPNLGASPFLETMWFSLLSEDGNNIDFFRGDELATQRLAPVPVGNAVALRIDNAGSGYTTGSIVWTIQEVR